ncbi:hypothetical protein AWENTII_008691 [Aspergillus wentii]
MQRLSKTRSWRYSSQQPPAAKDKQQHDPVLTAEDEAFLQQMMSRSDGGEASSPPPGDENNNTLLSPVSPITPVTNEARNTPLPASPAEDFGKELGEQGRRASEKRGSVDSGVSRNGSIVGKEKKWRPWSFLRRKPSGKVQDKAATAQSLQASTENPNDDASRQDAEDMTQVLEQLNLAADNNRVFSISEETQELMRKFKLIFKDLINGVPTAYNDLEMLLTNGNKQLQDTYTKLPGPLQKLIQKLPERWTESLAPEVLAAASAKAGKSGVNLDNMGKAAAAASKMGIQVPNLKELVAKPAALVGMMRSIIAFLRARFPAVLGVNVLWSLALSILLFVLWYCHKRGREVRLENERLVTEEEIGKLNEQAAEEQIRTTETLTTTAPQGASTEQIRTGVREAQQARDAAIAAAEEQRKSGNETAPPTPAPVIPTRTKSRLSMWSRSNTAPISPSTKIEPYPGT